jgi:hypothetical protein
MNLLLILDPKICAPTNLFQLNKKQLTECPELSSSFSDSSLVANTMLNQLPLVSYYIPLSEITISTFNGLCLHGTIQITVDSSHAYVVSIERI